MSKNKRGFQNRRRTKREFRENVFDNITKMKDKEFKKWLEENSDIVWIFG